MLFMRRVIQFNNHMIYIYMDDSLIIEIHSYEIKNSLNKMVVDFEMTDLGKFSYFLSSKFVKVKEVAIMHQ